MNKKNDILESWIMVEHLSEGDINLKDKNILTFRSLQNSDYYSCLLYTSPSPRDRQKSRMPSSA